MNNKYYLVFFDLYLDELKDIYEHDYFIYKGKKPTLELKEKWAEKLGYSSIINDIRECPKDRKAILNDYIKTIPIKQI